MKKKILKLKTYYIRSLTKKDVTQKYLSWLKDKKVTRFLEIKYNNYDMRKLKSYVESFKNDKSKFLFGIYCKSNNIHVGNVTLFNVNYNIGIFDIGILIGDKKYWGTQASTEAILLSLQFGFDFLKLRKVFTGVYVNHIMDRFILHRIGFIKEARLKEKFLLQKKLVDEIIYTVNKKQWPKIKRRFGL